MGSLPTFTPCLDALVEKYGLIGAGVFGRVWRYCQLNDGFCRASQETIATDLGLERRTVMRWLKILCADGFITDLTPNVINHAHHYKCTDAALSGVTLSDSTSVTESDSPLRGVTESDSKQGLGVTESDSQCQLKRHEDTETLSTETLPKVADATAKPATLKEWLDWLQKTKNYPALLRRMLEIHYPDNETPDFGYIGKIAKRMGRGVDGYRRLMQLAWVCSATPPVGDILAYFLTVHKGGNRNNGAHRQTPGAGEIPLSAESQAIAAALSGGGGSGGGGSG